MAKKRLPSFIYHDEEPLPLNQVPDSFLDIRWKIKTCEERGFPPDTQPMHLRIHLEKMIQSFIDSMRKDWVFTAPSIYYNPSASEMGAKIGMRRRTFHDKLMEKNK